MRRAAILLALGLSLCLPATAGAITLKRHVVIPHGVTHKADVHRVVVTTVAPPDSDDDGCPNDEDSYNGPGCNAPEPPVAAPVEESVAPATPVATSVPTASAGYSVPSYIVACESGGDYGAVNPSSGAYGAYQILPSTSAAYGCDMSSPAGQDACAGEIYADVGSSAWSCG